MGWFSDNSDQAEAYDQVINAPHGAGVSHELIVAAALYEAAKAYESHCAENGLPGSHTQAKELLSTISGITVDRIIERKGFDFLDGERVKRQTREQLYELSAENY